MTLLVWQRGGTPLGPVLVCCHPLGADGPGTFANSGWVERAGAAGMSLAVPDLPGHGASAGVVPPAGENPAAWTASALLDDLTRMGVERFALVGVDDGAFAAAHCAAKAPDRVGALILVGVDDHEGVTDGAGLAAELRGSGGLWQAEVAARADRWRRDPRHDREALARWAEATAWPAAPRLGAMHLPVMVAVAAGDAERRRRLPRLAALFHDGHLATFDHTPDTLVADAALQDAAIELALAQLRSGAQT